MRKSFFILIFLIINSVNLFSQIHWATKVDTVSSEYSNDRYGAKQILGLPNVDVQGRKSPYAWAVEPNEIDKEVVEIAFVEISFDDGHEANQIAIFESCNPGAISMVYYSLLSAGDYWNIAYADTAVISRSGMPEFQNNDKNLSDVAGTRKRKFGVFKKDSAFLPPTEHRILNIFLDKPEKIYRVRVVINPLAVDGWNQIDAVGITNSTDSIKYPKPDIVDQSLIIEPNSKAMNTNVNTPLSEISPIISPDGKRIYYSKKEFIKKANAWTQNIWYSDVEVEKKHACNPERQHNYKNVDIWQTGAPTYWEFNSVIPHTIVGFSADGQYMYINGLYDGIPDCKDCQDAFGHNTTGLSISKLDSTLFEEPYNTDLDLIDSTKLVEYQDYLKHDKILISRKFDSLKNKNFFYVQVNKGEKKTEWTKHNILGGYDEAPYSFSTTIKGDTLRYWIAIDSLNVDSAKISALNWSKPTSVNIENFENKSNYINFFIAPDGKHLLLSIETENSIGQRDLFFSELKEDGKTWSEPISLGKNINTIADESSPFLDGDNTTLYFSSTGHETYGEHDVFVSYMKNNDWTKWTKPQNLGSRINTPGDEVNFRINQETRRAYFATYEFAQGCKDKSDIFSIMMGKAITIHIKGVTRNANYFNKPLGDVAVSLKALECANQKGIREINFNSSVRTGEFDIKITKMVEANKMTKFGLSTKKLNYKQTDSLGQDTIQYVLIDLQNPDWEENIYMDLYLFGPEYDIPDLPEITQDDEIAQGDSSLKIIRDTVYLPEYIEVPVQGNVSVDTTVGCPFFYYAGKLYSISMSNDKSNPAQIIEVPASYTRHFDYNMKDVSINENEFKILKNSLFGLLQNNQLVNVFIQASASQVPTKQYCSNFELARMRAMEVENRLVAEMKNNNISSDRVFFDKRYVVEGNYDNDPEKKYKYKKYQYVKVWIYSCPLYNKEIKKD